MAAGFRATAPPFSAEEFLAVQDETWRELKRRRERDECLAKLRRLGLVVEG